MKKSLCLLLVCSMMILLLAACGGKKEITAEEAYQVVLEDLKETYGEAIADTAESPHIHESTYEGKACYNIFVTVSGMSLQYVISRTGDVLYTGAGEHSH